MPDLIERDAAIKLIQPRVKPKTVYGEGYLNAIEHVTELLALMPSANSWIPCSERMPDEPGIHVLATDGIRIMESWYEIVEGRALWVDNYTMYVNVNFGEVTHWMPLPAMPEVTANSFSASSMSGGSE